MSEADELKSTVALQKKRIVMLHGALAIAVNRLCRMDVRWLEAADANPVSYEDLQEAIRVGSDALLVMQDDMIRAAGGEP